MGFEYFAKLDRTIDQQENRVLFDLLTQQFGLICLSRSENELRLQTPDRPDDAWEAVRVIVKPQKIYVCFSGGNSREYPQLLVFISQRMAQAGFNCQFEEE